MHIFLILLFLNATAHAADQPRTSCSRQQPNDPVIYRKDFDHDYSLKEMAAKFQEMYQGPKRLKGRAYFDYRTMKYVFDYRGESEKKIPIPNEFIRNVTRHVEISLQRRYADFVFFPDLGHSHFHYPMKFDELYKQEKDVAKTYERMIANPELKVLYHTAEMMPAKDKDTEKLFDDTEVQWRYYARNPTGDNQNGENVAIYFAWGESYNTVRDIEGHGRWSAGFNISANKDGCFPYQHNGNTYYFDLSLEDLPYSENDSIWMRFRGKFRSFWEHSAHPQDYRR